MSYQEKISIYVPAHIKQQLEDDALQFEIFTKKDQTINMNKFLSQLILNFSDVYMEEYTYTYNEIHDRLSKYINNNIDCDVLSTQLLHEVIYPVSTKQKNRTLVAMSLKPTKDTESLIEQIRLDPQINDSLSRYFCRMFTSYCSKSSFERERIIFQDSIQIIQRALSSHYVLSFTSFHVQDKLFRVIPYKLVSNKEHLFNYLLCQDTESNKPMTFRLNRIVHPRLILDKTSINDETLTRLKKMEKIGPEYAISNDEEIIVRFTPEGEKTYKMIYFGRPRYTHIERYDDYALYHFDCSLAQAFHYFRRFEANAEVLSPQSLKEQLKTFHFNAYNTYNHD